VPVIAGNTAGTNLVNKATITATLAGRTLTLDDTAAVTVTVPVLKVSKLGPGVTVAANTSFPWTITAGVTGDASVNPLIMVDELPSTDIKFVPPVPNSKCSDNVTPPPPPPTVLVTITYCRRGLKGVLCHYCLHFL
jgi:hypothetical protein